MRKGRDSTEVLQLFEEVQRQGLEPNVITYMAVVSPAGVDLQLFV